MTSIGEKDIENLADLARMKLTEAERETLGKDLNNILGYVESIQSVEANTSLNDTLVDTVLREDTEVYESGVYTDAVLEEAPQSENGYVKVPKILTGNEE